MIEYRQVFQTEDIIGIELACTVPKCKGVFTFSVAQNGVPKHQHCPVCQSQWWDPTKHSHAYQILSALVDAQRDTWKGGVMEEGRIVEHQPVVKLILPSTQDQAVRSA